MKNYEVKFQALPCGETMAYRQAGTSGPLLLLLHGNQSSSVFFQPLMEALEAECRILAPDMIGFGDSSYTREMDSLREFALPVKELLEALALEADAALGWSTGGGVAMELAIMAPERVRSLILLDSVGLKGYPVYRIDEQMKPVLSERIYKREDLAQHPVSGKPVLEAFASGNKAFMRMVWNAVIYNLHQPCEEDYALYLDAMFKQRNLVDVLHALALFNISDEHNGVIEGNAAFRQIKCPITIVHGAEDLVVPLAWAQEAKAAFGDRAELHVIEAAGHAVLTDKPGELLAIIRSKLL